MITEKYYDKKEEIKKMVIKSSIVNEVIRGNFSCLLNVFMLFMLVKRLRGRKLQGRI